MRLQVIAIVVGMLFLQGCMISKSKYEAAVSDMESAKAELEKMRMHRDALEQQIETLKGANDSVSTDLEMMTAEVQRIKEGREGEQALLSSRKKELETQQRRLQSKYKRLTKEYQKLKGQNKTLKSTVVRYQKELKGSREKKMASITTPSPTMKSKTTPADQHGSHSTPPPSKGAEAPQKVVQLVNINKASASDLILFLGMTKEMADSVVKNRPYRLRGELVAKQVVPKTTFDAIKDRITAAR